MAEERVQRRLAAIMAADVVGYSRLMGEDEVGTLAALKAHWEALIDPAIAEHQGRIVKLMGDGALTEFASAVDALECAVAIQRGVRERNAEVSADRRIEFRIGINVGDIIVEGEDIYGNGVNVAARLEALAEPGGICISGRVLDQVEKNVDVGFAYLGPQSVKNIDKPVNAYRVLLDPADAGRIMGAPTTRAPGRPWLIAAVAVLVLAASSFGLWYYQTRPDFEPAEVAKMAYPLPEKPSLAVVPFRNLTGDPAQDTFVDGLTGSLISALTRVPDILIIDRGSAFAFRGEPARVKDVAEKFGVRYVLQGSVQRSGARIRIQTQLADALSGRAVWAADYDRRVGDVFDLQDDITHEILTELEVNLTQGEQARIRRRQTDSLDAYIAFLQGVEHFHNFTANEQVKAKELLEKAVKLDPSFASAYGYLGYVHIKQARNSWVDDTEKARRDGEALIAKALDLDPENVDALSFKGQILIDAGKREEAIEVFREAVRLAPNHVDNLTWLSLFLATTERDPEKVKTIVKRAMRLGPDYPTTLLTSLSLAHYFSGELDKAIELNETRRELLPNSVFPLIWLTIMNAKAGRMDAAREALSALREVEPDYSVVHFERLAKGWFRPETFADLVEQLKKAGAPVNRR